jgi:hypothetical protein
MPYGDDWRMHRRMFQQHFGERHLWRIQDRALHFIRKGMLAPFMEFPDSFREHVRK